MRQAAGFPLLGAAGVLLTVSLFFGGGPSDERLFWIGMGALAVLLACSVAALAGALVLPQPGRAGSAFLLLLAGYVAWNGVSVVWSIVPDRSWDSFNRGLVYLALGVVGVLAGSLVPRPARVVAWGLVVLLGAVVLWSLAGKVVPALFPDGARIARLRNPVGYWNALALLFDLALPLFLWLSARFRGAAALGIYLITVALALTYSRAGVAFGIAAVAIWLWLGLARRESLTALAIALPVALGVAGLGLALPGIAKDLQPEHVRVRDGAWFGLALLVGAVVVALLARRDLRRLELRILAAATVLLVAAGAGGLAARGSFLSQFRGDEVTQSSARIGSLSSNNRTTWWREAWQIFEQAPAGGKGAGSFQVARRPIRHNALEVTEPHDVAVQALAETGVFGFLLGGGAAIAAVLAAWGAARRLEGPERAAAAALAVAVPIYLLHALVDIDWEFVAASAPLFLVLGVLIGSSSRREAVRPSPLLALGAAVLVLASGYSLAAPWLAARDVRSANELLLADPARAVSDARSAHDLNPLSIEPYLAWAGAEIIRGHTTQALTLYERAVKLQPENGRTWFDLGVFEFQVLNDPCHAYDPLNHAYTLDPYGPAGTKNGFLDRARAVRNSGRC
jgi:tetratricopeptide (TPR) repeat protein